MLQGNKNRGIVPNILEVLSVVEKYCFDEGGKSTVRWDHSF